MDTVKNATRAGTLTVYRSTANGMEISDGSVNYEVKLDGKDYPQPGDAHSTISLNLIDASTMRKP